MPVASSLLHLATVIARLADSFSLARCQLRLRLGHTHLGNFHFVNTQAKLCDMCGLRTWTATGSTLVNVSVESRKCSLPSLPPCSSLSDPQRSHPKRDIGKLQKREINLYINCVKWICLQFKRLSILSSPPALLQLCPCSPRAPIELSSCCCSCLDCTSH